MMKHNLQTIKNPNKYNKNDFVFFWGHSPLKNGNISENCFSQWWKCNFYENGIMFICTEQYMMYHKALLFKDYEMAYLILKSDNPKDIKAYGRRVKEFDENLWDITKEQIVIKGNILKFSKNTIMLECLLNTKNKILVEASPHDRIWGIGMKKDAEDVTDVAKWKGLNLLGFALMDIRDRLL